MKRKILSFVLLLLFFVTIVSPVLAQEDNATETPTLAERFPALKIKDQFIQKATPKYFRFPADVWYFDPLGLSYFPHETMDAENWALLGRWNDGKTYKQMIYLDYPAVHKIIHGTDLGKGAGFLRDFYLYADLFVSDNYPENTGSCYFYYSDSLLVGYDTSYGVFIDPQDAIYKAENDYKESPAGYFSGYYDQGYEKHSLKVNVSLDPSKYAAEFSGETGDSPQVGSVGNELFPAVELDKQFTADWEFLNAAAENTGSPAPKAYRIEMTRIDGKMDISINGVPVASFEDQILTDKDGQKVPDKVSWSYGPILNKGGKTVTCSIGSLVIFGTGQRED